MNTIYNVKNCFRFFLFPLATEVTNICSERRKTRTCETSMLSNTTLLLVYFVVEQKLIWTHEMNESNHYPPPDFTRPPPDFIQPFHQQQQPRTSSFQASMWSWADAPREPDWDSARAGWQRGAGAGIGFNSNRGNYAPRRPYGKLYRDSCTAT